MAETTSAQVVTTRHTSSANLQSIGIVLLSVTLGAVGQLMLKATVNQLGQLTPSVEMLVRMISSPLLFVALGIYGISAVLWMLALMKADLSFAYPFLSLTYVAVLLGGAFLFNDLVTVLRVLGFVVIATGLIIITRGEARTTPDAKSAGE